MISTGILSNRGAWMISRTCSNCGKLVVNSRKYICDHCNNGYSMTDVMVTPYFCLIVIDEEPM